jgi:hypothetical protein
MDATIEKPTGEGSVSFCLIDTATQQATAVFSAHSGPPPSQAPPFCRRHSRPVDLAILRFRHPIDAHGLRPVQLAETPR